MLSGAVSSMIVNDTGKMDFKQIAADGFGNALADSLVSVIAKNSRAVATEAVEKAKVADGEAVIQQTQHVKAQLSNDPKSYETYQHLVLAGVDSEQAVKAVLDMQHSPYSTDDGQFFDPIIGNDGEYLGHGVRASDPAVQNVGYNGENPFKLEYPHGDFYASLNGAPASASGPESSYMLRYLSPKDRQRLMAAAASKLDADASSTVLGFTLKKQTAGDVVQQYREELSETGDPAIWYTPESIPKDTHYFPILYNNGVVYARSDSDYWRFAQALYTSNGLSEQAGLSAAIAQYQERYPNEVVKSTNNLWTVWKAKGSAAFRAEGDFWHDIYNRTTQTPHVDMPVASTEEERQVQESYRRPLAEGAKQTARAFSAAADAIPKVGEYIGNLQIAASVMKGIWRGAEKYAVKREAQAAASAEIKAVTERTSKRWELSSNGSAKVELKLPANGAELLKSPLGNTHYLDPLTNKVTKIKNGDKIQLDHNIR